MCGDFLLLNLFIHKVSAQAVICLLHHSKERGAFDTLKGSGYVRLMEIQHVSCYCRMKWRWSILSVRTTKFQKGIAMFLIAGIEKGTHGSVRTIVQLCF